MPTKEQLDKPLIDYVAYYECNSCPDPATLTFATKVEVPQTHPELGTDLLWLEERITTLLWLREEEGRENNQEEKLPDRAD